MVNRVSNSQQPGHKSGTALASANDFDLDQSNFFMW